MGDPRDIRFDGERYPVLEIFTSIQSEGARCGTLTHFLRLGGCSHFCSFCDTPMEPYTMMTPAEIGKELRTREEKVPTGWQVVITGGEPMVHDLMPLLKELGRPTIVKGFFVAMESNGSRIHMIAKSQPEVLHRIDWLTVSPKAPVTGFLLRKYASEVKYIVPDHEDLIDWQHSRVFVQPEFNNGEALKRCLHWMSKYPNIRMSFQAHKYLGLR